MIGSILGVGLMNEFLHGRGGTSGLDWTEVIEVLKALVFSPIIGFVLAALVYFGFKLLIKDPRLFESPEGTAPPPLAIRALLVLTCTGVSFAHGSNDGQKGMGTHHVDPCRNCTNGLRTQPCRRSRLRRLVCVYFHTGRGLAGALHRAGTAFIRHLARPRNGTRALRQYAQVHPFNHRCAAAHGSGHPR